MIIKVYGNTFKLLMILTLLAMLFIYLISENITKSYSEPNNDRITKIEECQRIYCNCTSYCKNSDCLNKCANELRNCQN